MKIKKPPLGVMPKYIWLSFLECPDEPSKEEINDRKKDLAEAIHRYLKADLLPRVEWTIELNSYS